MYCINTPKYFDRKSKVFLFYDVDLGPFDQAVDRPVELICSVGRPNGLPILDWLAQKNLCTLIDERSTVESFCFLLGHFGQSPSWSLFPTVRNLIVGGRLTGRPTDWLESGFTQMAIIWICLLWVNPQQLFWVFSSVLSLYKQGASEKILNNNH